MKNTSFIALAAGLAGVAFLKLGNAAFLANIPGDVVVAIVASAALLAFAIRDYARDIRPLTPKTSLVRPIVRVSVVKSAAPAPAKAYGVSRQSALVERSAA